MGNHGTTYIPQMSIPVKTGQGASEHITAGDNGDTQAGFYRGPSRFIVTGNLVTDLYTMLQWVKDPSKIFVGDDGLSVPTVTARGDYDNTVAYNKYDQATVNNGLTAYIARQNLPAALTDSNAGTWHWAFTASPGAANLDAGGRLYYTWQHSGVQMKFWKDAAHTQQVGASLTINGFASVNSLPAPLGGYVEAPSVNPADNSGTLTFATFGGVIGGAILPLAANSFNPAVDGGGFWSTFGTGAAVTWSQALTNCVNLTYGGASGWSGSNPLGWRMPTITEAITIYDFAAASTPYGNSNFVWPAGSMWTSTIPKYSATKAFALSVNGPTTSNCPFIMNTQSSTGQTRPVRSLIFGG